MYKTPNYDKCAIAYTLVTHLFGDIKISVHVHAKKLNVMVFQHTFTNVNLRCS